MTNQELDDAMENEQRAFGNYVVVQASPYQWDVLNTVKAKAVYGFRALGDAMAFARKEHQREEEWK